MQHSIRSDNPDDRRGPKRLPRAVREPGGDRDRPERAVVVGVLVPETKADLREPLAELSALA